MEARSLIRGLSITKQNPAVISRIQQEVRLTAVLTQSDFHCILYQVEEKYTVLSVYEDNWPSRDMISTVLRNTHPKVTQ
jgi:hypothetical protein